MILAGRVGKLVGGFEWRTEMVASELDRDVSFPWSCHSNGFEGIFHDLGLLAI